MRGAHNGKRIRLYKIWERMRGRCFTTTDSQYKNYGARGIKIEWKSFSEFAEDMKESFEKHSIEYGGRNTTLDRIDNNGNYSKENCRWSTWKEQSNNTRRCRWITHKGERLTANQWAEKLGISKWTIYWRMNQGWDTARTLTPLQKNFDKSSLTGGQY